MKKTKTLKGMTLVECIVALVVMSIMGTLLIMGVTTVFHMRKNTEVVLTNTAYETPYAEKRHTAAEIFDPVSGEGAYTTQPANIEIAGESVGATFYSVIPPDGDGNGLTYFEVPIT